MVEAPNSHYLNSGLQDCNGNSPESQNTPPHLHPDAATNIPKAIRNIDQWITWKFGVIDTTTGKCRKLPMGKDGTGTAWQKENQWMTFEEAIDEAKRRGHSGIGLVLPAMVFKGEHLVATDHDKVGLIEPDPQRNKRLGEIEKLYEELGKPYTEKTPSGDGMRMLLTSTEPLSQISSSPNPLGGADEIFSASSKWITVTGNKMAGEDVPKATAAIKKIHESLSIRKARSKPNPSPVPPTPLLQHLIQSGGFQWPAQKLKDGDGREETMLRFAGHLRGHGHTQAEIERLAHIANQEHYADPLDEATLLDRCRRYEKPLLEIPVADAVEGIPQWVADLNASYAWIDMDAGVYRTEYGNFIEPAKFKVQFDNQTVNVASKFVGKGTAWLKHHARRQHNSLVLRPNEGPVTTDNCLNEWKGFAVASAAGDIKPFLWLSLRLIPNREARHYVLKWLAHLIQRPANKMHVSLAFWSQQQGVGKNLLFECMTAIIGAAHSTVIGQAELASNFNGWANRKVLVIGDEVSNSDRRQDTDRLKGLVTGTTIYINEKYQPARDVSNLLNFIFLSNHNDALFVGDQDRRYFVWEICADRLPEAKANEFVSWRDAGGLSALLHFLMNVDLCGFNPKAPAPMTDAKQQMVQDSRSDLENWIAELMGSNVTPLIGRELATGNELARRYSIETGRQEPSAKTIVSACKKHGAVARTNQVRMSSGKKLRVLALTHVQHWSAQTEASWATEMAKPFKLT